MQFKFENKLINLHHLKYYFSVNSKFALSDFANIQIAFFNGIQTKEKEKQQKNKKYI